MSGYSDLIVYESEAERNAVCAELARMLRVLPLNPSPATTAVPPCGVGQPLDRVVAGDSNLENIA